MTLIRLLHCSDLHIAKVPYLISPKEKISAGTFFDALRTRTYVSSYAPARLLRLVDFIHQTNRSASPLDAILLSGDIATTGLQADLEVALRFIDGPSHHLFPSLNQHMEPTLATVNAPIWLLPGNHDRYVRAKVTGYSPGGKLFYTIFGAHWGANVKAFTPVRRPDISLSVIAADLSLRNKKDRRGGWINKYAQGRAYQDVLDDLERETDNARNDHARNHSGLLALMWAVHFPPHFPSLSRTMRLIDSSSLIRRANKCGVTAILAGHTHEPVRYRTPSMKFEVLCAGTASQYFAPNRNHVQIIEVSADSTGLINVECQNYTFDITASRFLKV